MISQEQTTEIVKRMQEVFPKSNPKVNNKAGGGAYAITTVVESINKASLNVLDCLVTDTKTNIILKRSGTGISVQFN